MWETTVKSELLLNQESSLLNQGGSLFQLLPEYFLAVSGLFFMLSLSALQQEVWKLNYQRPVSYCYLFIVCITGYLVLNDEVLIFGGLTCYSPVNGSLTFFSKLLVCGFSAMYFFITANFLSDQKIVNFEFLSISLLAVLGLLLLCSSYDLLTAYLAIELISLASYLLASFRKDSHYSVSAGLKYFIIGSVSSAFFLLGSSFIYACSGSIFFLDIHDLFNSKLEFKPSFDKHIEMHEYFATSKQETSELNIKAGGQPKKLLTTKYFYPDSETVAYFEEKVALNFGETLNMDKALTDFTSKDAVMLTKIILLEKKFGLDWQNSVGRPLLSIENFAEAIFKERYKIFDPEVLEAFMRKELPKETFLKLTAKEQSSLVEIATWVDKYQNHPESVLTFLFKNRLTEPLVCEFIFLQHLAAIISVFVHMGMDSASIADLLTELLLNWQNKYGATWIQDVVRYELLKEIPLNIENAYNYIAEKSSINLKENLNQATNSEKDECFGIEQFYHCVCRDVSLRDKEGMPLPVCDKAYPFVKTLRDHKLDLARSLDDEFCNNSLKELKILDALKAKLEAENFELNEYKDLQFVCEYIVENCYDHRHLKTPYAEVLSKEVQIPLWKKAYGEDWAKVVVKEYFLNKPFTVSNLSAYAMEIYFKDIDLEAAAANPESKDGKKLAIKNAAIKKYGPNWAEHLVLLGMANTPLVSSEVLSFFISSHFDNINMDAIKNPGSLERKKAIQLAAWMLHGGPDWLEGLSRNLIIEQQEYSYKKECIEIMGLHFGEVDPKDALFNPNSKDYALINKLRNWARTYGVDWQTTVGAEIIEQIITEKFIRLEVTFDKIISESHGEINYEIALSDVNSKDFKLLMQRLVWAQKYGLNWEEVVVDKIVSKPLPFKSLYKYIIETHYGREKFTNSPEKIWNTSFILNLFEYRVKYGDNWEEKLVSEIIGKPVTRSNIYDFIIDQKYGVVNFDNASENFSLKVVESVVQRLIFKCNYGPNWKEIVSFKIVDSFFNHSYFLSYLSLKKKILPQENFSLSSFKLVQLGILLVLISAFIKLALAPFHLWSLDVYEGSPTSAAFFFAVITKISFFIFMVRFCYASFFNFGLEWQFYIACIATASVFAGSVGGLTQNKLKTLLAYSSISHMGYCALAMCTASLLGIQILLFYLIIYTISGVCTWYILMLLKVKTKKNSKFSKELADLSQLSRSNPALALAFSITMFSLAGLPPFVGFIAKFSVFLSLLKAKFYFICAFAILCSVISTFYYIRIVKVLYFENVLISKLYYPIKTNKVSALSALIFSLIFLFLNPNLLFLIIYDVVYNSFI